MEKGSKLFERVEAGLMKIQQYVIETNNHGVLNASASF
jgi:hypothetical protein